MIYTEITPNPSTLKFITDETQVMDRGTADFPNEESAEASPLAKLLFNFEFVEGVFLGSNFVTITKPENYKWEEIIPKVKQAIRDFFESGEPVITDDSIISGGDSLDAEDGDEVVRKIKKLLDEQVRPAVAMDGGDIVFEGFDDGIVKVKLQGSCQGCPSSTMTLKMGIERLLTRFVPEVKSVEAV